MKSSFEAADWLPPGGPFVPEPWARGDSEAGGAAGAPTEDTGQAEALARLRAELADELARENRARIESALAALDEAARGWREVEARELEAVRDGIVELALAIAGHVLERELSADPAAFAALVERALQELMVPSGARIALSPADLERVQSAAAEPCRALAECWSAELVADATLAAGEARVEAGEAQVDLRLESLLARVRAELAPGRSPDPGDGDAESAT